MMTEVKYSERERESAMLHMRPIPFNHEDTNTMRSFCELKINKYSDRELNYMYPLTW